MYHYELEKLGINLGGRFQGQFKVKCPVCNERKSGTTQKDLSVNLNEGLYHCHNSNCDFKGRAHTKEYSAPVFNPNLTNLPNNIVKYMEGRGISQSTLKKMKVGVSDKGSLTFNYFRNGELVNTKTRWTTKDGKKAFSQHVGSEKILFNLDSLKGKEKCIIVEGEIDVLSWIEAGVSKDYGIVSVDMGAPSPGQNIGSKLDCISNCASELDGIKEFYIATDKDAPGQYLEQILIKRFGEYRCKRVEFPQGAKDTNEVLCTDGYDTSVNCQTLKLCLSNAKSIPVPGIHVLDDAQRELMLDNFKNGKQKGSTTHFPGIDPHFTWYAGDMTGVTGIPMSGKGQCTRQLMIAKSKIDNWKWAVYAPEDFPAEDFWDDVIHAYIGKDTDPGDNQMSIEEYHRGMDFAKEYFYLIHPEEDENGETKLPDNRWINEQIRFLRLRYGVNAYIKDPWNKIYHNMKGGEREDQYLAKELSTEKFFAKLFDAAVYIAHPKGMKKGSDGKIERPTAYDISGGAMWNNMFDNILVFDRPNIHENPNDKVTEFRSLKIKKQKRVGKPGYFNLWFDEKKKRYYQMGSDYSPFEDPKLGNSFIVEDDQPQEQFDPTGADLPF